MDAYIFPPWPLIAAVLTKLQSEQGCVLTMVVPCWPNRSWFPLLLGVLIDIPRLLPLRHDLIVMPHNGKEHGALEMLDLHVCRISSNPELTKAFRTQCRRDLQWAPSEIQPQTSTTLDGRSFPFGVIDGMSIHARLL
jgi:hypothetical protein